MDLLSCYLPRFLELFRIFSNSWNILKFPIGKLKSIVRTVVIHFYISVGLSNLVVRIFVIAGLMLLLKSTSRNGNF